VRRSSITRLVFRELGPELVMNFLLFCDEGQIRRIKIEALLDHLRCSGHWPQERYSDGAQFMRI
jgi:hypothetical protein